jgi:hypothetical protein
MHRQCICDDDANLPFNTMIVASARSIVPLALQVDCCVSSLLQLSVIELFFSLSRFIIVSVVCSNGQQRAVELLHPPKHHDRTPPLTKSFIALPIACPQLIVM